MFGKTCTTIKVVGHCGRYLSGILLLLFSGITTTIAQTPSFCGSFGPFQAPTNNPDSIVFDRFGNTYLKDELIANSPISTRFRSAAAGYFELYINDTIPADEEAVICRVFSDVSKIIQQRQLTTPCGTVLPSPKIGIKVELQKDPGGVEDGQLGVATPLYQGLFNNCPNGSEGVQHSNIMRKLNGELLRTSIDGIMAVDIVPPSTYYYGEEPTAIPSDHYDLYSIVLHEVMHLIGYSGVTGSNGLPNTNFSSAYSAWDRILHTTTAYDPGGNSQNTRPLLTSDCVHNCYQINNSTFGSIQVFQEAVEGNCTNNAVDIIVGESGLAPIMGGGLGNFPNQISHLNPDCGNNPNYVMQPSLDTGVTRRDLTDAEMSILCALGYQTDDCDGCYFSIGHSDIRNTTEYRNCCNLFYSTCPNQPLRIAISDLLCNDFTNGAELELTSVFPRTSPSVYTLIIVGDSIEFKSDEQGYFSGIGYTVKGCDCQLLSGSFAVNVGPCEIECVASDPCEDVLCLNGFDDYRNISHNANGTSGASGEFYPGTPFWINSTQNNSPDIYYCSTDDNVYIFCGGFPTSAGGVEGFAVPVDPPIAPGCSLDLSLDLSQTGSHPTAAAMVVKGSDQYPCTIVGSTIGATCANSSCGGNNQNYVCLGLIESTTSSPPLPDSVCSVNWGTHQLSWTNSQSYPIRFLIFHPQSQPGGAGGNDILVDNISASLSCADNITTTHSIQPQVACDDQELAIELTVCAAAGAGIIDLDYHFSLPTETTLVSGDLSGLITLTGGDCEILDFIVSINAAPITDSLSFELDYLGLGACSSYPFEVPLVRLPDPGFSYTLINCADAEFISIASNPADEHFWDFGDGTTSTALNPTHQYADPGTYAVVHTTSNACGSISSTQSVTVLDTQLEDAGFMVDIEECSTLVRFFSTAAMNGETHQWDFDGNINTIESTEINPVFDFTTPGSYTATHYVTNSCGISNTTQSIIIEECVVPCDCPNLIEGEDGIAYASSSLPSSNIDNTGSCLSVYGTLVIDVSTRITGGKIEMQPGAKIIVNNLVHLELLDVNLHGCDQMWQGIEVRGFGYLSTRNTLIQDAHWAIKAYNNANLNIGKSVFSNNYIGIYTAPTTNGAGQFVNARISTTHFSGTQELLPRYTNQPPTLSERSRAGVELYNTYAFVVGGQRDRARANNFTGLHYGVYTQDCFGISIQRAQMNGLIGAATGVYMNNSVNVTIDRSEMADLDYGVQGFRSSPTVLESSIDSKKEGIQLLSGISRSAIIRQSNIISPYSCIYISDYSGDRVEVSECILFKKDGQDAAAAVFINNCTAARTIVADNPSIAFSASGFGIRLANSYGAITIENNPSIYSTGDYFANVGITLSNVSGAQVYNNSVNNSGIYAISSFDSPNNLFCCNQVNKARDGVFLGGGCARTRLKNTDFGKHKYGLNLFDAVISPQAFHGNSWIGADCDVFDAVFSSNNTSSNLSQSQIITNILYVPRGYSFIRVYGGGTPQEWFIFEPEVDPHCTYYCNETPYLVPPPHSPCTQFGNSEELTVINHWAATDLDVNDDITKGIHYREQRSLLSKLDCVPSLLGQDHQIDQFYLAAQSNSLGQHYQHYQAVQSLFAPFESQTLLDLYEQRGVLVEQLQQLDSTSLSEEGLDLIEQINGVIASINQLETIDEEQRINTATDLIEMNHSLSENEIYERNEKKINEIVLSTVAQGQYHLSEEQKVIIDEIASQCLLSGGLAVHQARGLQALFQPQLYDEQDNCYISEQRQNDDSIPDGDDDQVQIKVYPNPASHLLHIQTEHPNAEQLYIEFWTAQGKIYKNIHIDSSIDIDLREWSSGVYFYCIKDENEILLLKNKLIVVKPF